VRDAYDLARRPRACLVTLGIVLARPQMTRRRVPTCHFGVSHSIYFEDPEGLQLELTTYEV
jgi:hypothetical protein